jgi:hypothetical protein
VNTATKLASKFIKKMTEHVEDGTVPKEIPPFARLFFVDKESTITPHVDHPTGKPTASTVGEKRKSDGTDIQTKKKRDIRTSCSTRTSLLAWASSTSRRVPHRLRKPFQRGLNSRMEFALISVVTEKSASLHIKSVSTGNTILAGSVSLTMTRPFYLPI